MKKSASMVLAAVLAAFMLAGCTGRPKEFAPDTEITVVSREDGSGTRGAFVELFGVEQKNEAGEKVDRTTVEANITNSTSIILATVAGDRYAIGYISLGSLNNDVRALDIDGAKATMENVLNGSYHIARPFNIATLPDVNGQTQDFINFILSEEGQKIVAANGYIPLPEAPAFRGSREEGKIVVAGSSSVSPLMEKLKEAYMLQNPHVSIEIQQNDSSTGMASAIAGICDIGMASRELKDSEKSAGLQTTVIAKDGLAVIVNLQNPLHELSSEQVRQIYTGEIITWAEVGA